MPDFYDCYRCISLIEIREKALDWGYEFSEEVYQKVLCEILGGGT